MKKYTKIISISERLEKTESEIKTLKFILNKIIEQLEK